MRKFLFFLIFILILVSAGIVYWKYSFTYSEGFRAGLLQKFSRKGTFFKTYEGEMILSSIQSNTNIPLASEKFFFSVTDDALARQMERLQGENIIIHYNEKNSTLPWRGDSRYIVDSVRVSGTIRGTPPFRQQ